MRMVRTAVMSWTSNLPSWLESMCFSLFLLFWQVVLTREGVQKTCRDVDRQRHYSGNSEVLLYILQLVANVMLSTGMHKPTCSQAFCIHAIWHSDVVMSDIAASWEFCMVQIGRLQDMRTV